MLAGASSDPNVDAAECQGALEWAEGGSHSQGIPGGDCAPFKFDRVLLKEVVHHLDAPERLRVFSSLRSRRLTHDGRVLIITRPQYDIDYPLWPAAREVWAANQPSEGELMEELRAAGFGFVRLHAHAYPHAVPTDEWCRLVKGRFWSTFANFRDDELEAGCAQLREEACKAMPPIEGEEHLVRFEDRLLLIEARVAANDPMEGDAKGEGAIGAGASAGVVAAGTRRGGHQPTRSLSTQPASARPETATAPTSYIHMNAAGASPMPLSAHEAMVGYLELERSVGAYAAAHRKPHTARAALSTLLGCDESEVALFDSAQAAWARAFYSLGFASSADRILCFEAEYAGNAVAFLQMAKRSGVQIEVLPMREDGIIDMSALEAALQAESFPTDDEAPLAGRTLVALTHVQTDSSIVQPAAAVGALCRAHGAVYLLDACQSIGQLPVDVGAIGCDFACGTGRKWLRGPRGTGFLYASREALDTAARAGSPSSGQQQQQQQHGKRRSLFGEPPIIDHSGVVWTTPDSYTMRDDARRFEMWEADEAARHGLAAAVEHCTLVGPGSIYDRATALAARLRASLEAVPGCVLRDAPPTFDEEVARTLGASRCAIVTFEIESTLGVPAAELRDALDARGISSTVSPAYHSFDPSARARPPSLRLSPSYFTTEAEIDVVIDALREEIAQRAEGGGLGAYMER